MNEDVVNEDRSIQIGKDAIGNAIISGSGNVVIIESVRQQTTHAEKVEAGPIGPNPYLGLLAFHESDADRFFGREKQTKRLWNRLRELQSLSSEADARILPVTGPSGSGKSSLARAGLVAELARSPLPGMRDARVAVLTPGARPLEAMAGVLARIATGEASPIEKTQEFERVLKQQNEVGEFDGLRRIADSLPDIGNSPLILLIDQFEEIYSICREESQQLATIENLLCAAGDASGRVSVVMTLRTDFIDETQRHERLNALICEQHLLIPAMNEAELREAITKPAQNAGHELDEATVTLLVNDTRDREGALPLLQFALRQIWDGLAEGVGPAVTYQQIGGVGGALAGEAARIYSELSDDDKRIARRVFLGLVQLGEGTRDTRRRADIRSLVAVSDDLGRVESVIQRFSSRDARLITVSADAKNETAEVTHEALFNYWDQLNDWLEESRDDVRFQRRLDDAARNWEENGRPDGSLWRSPDLDLLIQFQKRAGDDMTPLEVEFFEASRDAEAKLVAEKERQQNALRKYLRIAIASTVAVAILLVAASIIAYWGWRNAKWATAKHEEAETAKKDLIFKHGEAEQAKLDAIAKQRESESITDYLLGNLKGNLPNYIGIQDSLEKAETELVLSEESEQARLLDRLGSTYVLIGDLEKGEELLKQAQSMLSDIEIGRNENYTALDQQVDLALSNQHLGVLRLVQGRADEAMELAENALANLSHVEEHEKEILQTKMLLCWALGETKMRHDAKLRSEMFRRRKQLLTEVHAGMEKRLALAKKEAKDKKEPVDQRDIESLQAEISSLELLSAVYVMDEVANNKSNDIDTEPLTWEELANISSELAGVIEFCKQANDDGKQYPVQSLLPYVKVFLAKLWNEAKNSVSNWGGGVQRLLDRSGEQDEELAAARNRRERAIQEEFVSDGKAALEKMRRVYGGHQPAVLWAELNFAKQISDPDIKNNLLRTNLAATRDAIGSQPRTVMPMFELAAYLETRARDAADDISVARDYKEAEELLLEAVEIMESASNNRWRTGVAQMRLAEFYAKQDKYIEALKWFDEAKKNFVADNVEDYDDLGKKCDARRGEVAAMFK